MKRLSLLVLLVALFSYGFSQPFVKGDNVIGFGLGVGTPIYSGKYYKMWIPPSYVSYERGITKKLGIGSIGVGGWIGITGSKYEIGNDGFKYLYTTICARAAYHFELVEKLDIYAGVMSGFMTTSYSNIGDPGIDPEKDAHMRTSIYGGIRYYVSPKFALTAEATHNIYYLTIGLAFKF